MLLYRDSMRVRPGARIKGALRTPILHNVSFGIINATSGGITRVDGSGARELLLTASVVTSRFGKRISFAASGRPSLASPNMTMTGAPVIHVVDDDASFRAAISRLLKASGYEVANYESATSFLRAFENTKPGCILLDVQMPALGGLQLQEELAKLSHNWPIIFMTGHGDIPTSVRAIKAGAEDFLSKPVSKEKLLEAIERALARYDAIKQSRDQLNSFRSLIATLTPREAEVFALMVRGKLNKQIAHELGTSERTVKAHRRMVMQKLQVKSFAEAVSLAERVGLLTAPLSADAKYRG
jgi:FixJ family two-component response regulator